MPRRQHGISGTRLRQRAVKGQSAVYVKSQLEAFASNDRPNDISEQMRNIARRMMSEEIEEATQYYASQPSPGVGSEAR